jgi:hypothetical protein
LLYIAFEGLNKEKHDDMNYDEGINPTPRPKRKIVMPKCYEGFDTRTTRKGGKK